MNLNVIVVDNNSQDNSVQLLKEYKGLAVNVIESEINLGFGSGCNLALPYLDYGFTLFLNPDVRLQSDSISKLLEFAIENPKAMIWGGQTVNADGAIDGQNAWREPTLKGIVSWSFFGDIILKKLGKRIPDAYTPTEIANSPYVDSISGCFLLIDTKLLQKLAGFDEQFFMYSEEVDLCRRARKLGATPMSTNSAVIMHEGSKTITSQNKLNFLYHSKLKYIKKYWKPTSFIIARFSLFSGAVLRCLLYSLLFFKKRYRTEASVWFNFCKQQVSWKIKYNG
jgi:hypothetical protein